MQNKEIRNSLMGLLTIVFIILKLTEVIMWSWWWVLSPLWLPIIINIVIITIIVIIFRR
jgi:hypothetical protein